MKEQITRCDICTKIIDSPGGNGMVSITPGLHSQVWTTPDGDRDVCAACLSILQIAAGLGMIEIPMAQFYEGAGFAKDESGHWRRPSGETSSDLENFMARWNK